MFLKGIGIYVFTPNKNGVFPEYRLVDGAPTEKSKRFNLSFWQDADSGLKIEELDGLKSHTIPKIPLDVKKDRTYYFHCREEKEHHYLIVIPKTKLTATPFNTDIILSLVTTSELLATEYINLFKNILYILTKHAIAEGRSLNDIIKNPVNYVGDLKLTTVDKALKETINIMFDNMDKLLKRGESLESLEEKSETLKLNAVKFEKKASKLPPNCCSAALRY